MDAIVGAMLGHAVGTPDGTVVGASVGKVVRRVVGFINAEGTDVTRGVGPAFGTALGEAVGAVGTIDADALGGLLGTADGVAVGYSPTKPPTAQKSSSQVQACPAPVGSSMTHSNASTKSAVGSTA